MPTKRSHYLPRTYLKHFLLDNRMYLYKKGEKFFKKKTLPKERVHEIVGEATLINFGLENNLYNPGVEGLTSDDVEDIFNEYGEANYDSIVSFLESAKIDSDIPKEVKSDIAIFMAAMRVRTPQFKAEIAEIDSGFLKSSMKRIYGDKKPEELIFLYKKILGKEISEKKAEDIINNFKDGTYDLEYPNIHFIKSALQFIDFYADIFNQMVFTIYKSQDKSFITSDNPVVFFVPPEHTNAYTSPKALCHKYTELFFPITKNLILHATWRKGEEKISILKNSYVETFNYNISHNSFDYLFSPKMTKSLEKFTINYIPYPYRFYSN